MLFRNVNIFKKKRGICFGLKGKKEPFGGSARVEHVVRAMSCFFFPEVVNFAFRDTTVRTDGLLNAAVVPVMFARVRAR